MLSTHGHGDHTGGHPEFIKVAEIIAHRNNRANMMRSKLAAPPRLVFSDQAAVFLGGVEVQAIYMGRGHTNGDAVIYFPDLRTVHTGDLVVWGKRTDGSILTPFVDRASGGSLVEWITTLDGVLKLDFDTAIPGHGPVLTKDNVRTFRQNLVTLRQRITEVVKAGAKKEEFGAKLKTDDLGWPFPPERLNELWDEFGAGTIGLLTSIIAPRRRPHESVSVIDPAARDVDGLVDCDRLWLRQHATTGARGAVRACQPEQPPGLADRRLQGRRGLAEAVARYGPLARRLDVGLVWRRIRRESRSSLGRDARRVAAACGRCAVDTVCRPSTTAR